MNETCITFFCLIYYIIYKAYIILFILLMYTKKLYNLIIFSYLFHILLFIIVKAFAFFFLSLKKLVLEISCQPVTLKLISRDRLIDRRQIC